TLLANYDGLWVGAHDALYRALFGDGDNWRPMLRASERGLELFGARYVLTRGAWPPIDTLLPLVPDSPTARATLDEILPGADVAQPFTAPYDGLSGVRLSFETYGRSNDCLLALRLTELESGATVAEQAVRGLDLVPGRDGRAEVAFRFPRV